MNSIRMLRNLVLIGPMPVAVQTERGLIVVENKREPIMRGMVLACGDGGYDEKGIKKEMPVSPGQLVMFSTGSVSHVTHEGEKLMVIPAHDVICTLKPDVTDKRQ